MSKNRGDEVTFYGTDGIARKAWVAHAHSDGTLLDLTFNPPGGSCPPHETLPAYPVEEGDEDKPESHPSVPPVADTYNVAPWSGRKPNRPYWRDARKTDKDEAAKQKKDEEAEEKAEKDAKVAAKKEAEANAKAAREAGEKEMKEKEAESKKAAASGKASKPVTAVPPDRDSPDYLAGAAAKKDGATRDTTKSALWLAGYDGK